MAIPTRAALIIGLATFVLALTIRLLGVDVRAPWLDEVYSQFAISREWYGLASDRISRGHSPLYFALMKAFGISGDNVVAMRTASSVFDAGGAAVLAGALCLHVGRRAGLFFGFLYAFSPLAIHWAQNARPYGLLMLFLGIGLAGALGLLATLGRESAPQPRRATRLFRIGFSFACLTMSAGIFAYISTAILPFLLPRTRRDKAFMARWKRAIKWPAIIAILAYIALSGPHIARQVDGYWADKYTTLGIEGLGRLWRRIFVDGGLTSGLSQTGFPPEPAGPLLWAMSLLLLLFAALGLAEARRRPALLAPALLLAGYTVLLLCVSTWTSVLVPRYFLPPWICLLALAGAGMARMRVQTVWSWLLIGPLMALIAAVGLVQATLPGSARDRSLQPVAEIIARVPPETVRILYEKKGGTRNKLILELFPMRYARPELERPSLLSLQEDRLAQALSNELDTFVFVPAEQLTGVLSETAVTPLCVRDFDDWALAYWGDDSAVCLP